MCLGYFAYLFTNQEVNDQAGNLITISLMHGWQRKGAGSAIMGALFGMDVLRSQYSLFAKVDTLSRFNIRSILKPDVYDHYEQTLQEAYDALTEVEDALTTLGMKLEYQHFRLGGAVDELKPLMIASLSIG